MSDDMICNCDEEGIRDAEARRLRVFQRLGCHHPYDLVPTVLASLALSFGCDDAWVDVDQWFGFGVTTPLCGHAVWTACDSVVDGLLAVWERLAAAHPDRVVGNATPPGDILAESVRRVQASLIARYAEVEGAYRAHRAAAHRDDNDCPPCVECEVGMSLRAHAMWSLDRLWGDSALDAAIEASCQR